MKKLILIIFILIVPILASAQVEQYHLYNSTTTPYWIIRKPCIKEVFNKAVGEGIKK